MNKIKDLLRLRGRLSPRVVIGLGLALLLIAASLSGHQSVRRTRTAAETAMNTLKQQCSIYNKLTAADRTKSLFRLSDLMRELSAHLAQSPESVTDEYLKQYVDGLRLSGVAVLNAQLRLEASGYTQRFRDADWASSQEGSRFADIIEHPRKVFMERLTVDGEYYDICAVARKDAPGIVVGFFHQPSGLITGTENDLAGMIGGLQLERNGRYIIAENDTIRVTSADVQTGAAATETDMLQGLSGVPKDNRLHLIRVDGRRFWGYRSGCENYSLYIYYPSLALASTWILTAAIVAAVYSATLLGFILLRNRALYEKQKELEQSNCNLTRTVNMLRALETIYFTLFYVDLDTDQYETIYISPWLKPSIPESGSYTGLKQTFLDSMIVPAYCEEIDRRMSIVFIRENLSQENLTDVRKSFYTDYQAIRGTQIKWCRVSAAAVDYHEDGKPHHVLALLQDVDKEKALEADYQARIVKEANEAKIANEAKTEFLRRISHDIRTPINGIQGYINMATSHPEDLELQRHCREKATMALNTLLTLVNSVLNMSKLESGELVLEQVPFDLTELLDRVNVMLIPQAAAKNVRYEVLRTGGVPIPHLIGSPRHVSQVIMNVTTNAVKYSRPGGYVRVNTSLIAQTGDTATYEFVCEDNGVGMSREFQQHMYDPFAQETIGARSTYEGVGLGLAIMKKLITAMGGTVCCESEKDVGTTFRVQLTFRIDHAYQPPEKPHAEPEAGMFPGRRVLLVEDNELNMEIAEMLLKERGVQVTRAWNGKEAVERFAAAEPGFYDLIFMDIMMPELDGLEATRKIRRMERPDAKTIPIFAMSANAFQDDIQRSLDAGMDGHLSKPIDPAQLYQVLERCTHGRGKKMSGETEYEHGTVS